MATSGHGLRRRASARPGALGRAPSDPPLEAAAGARTEGGEGATGGARPLSSAPAVSSASTGGAIDGDGAALARGCAGSMVGAAGALAAGAAAGIGRRGGGGTRGRATGGAGAVGVEAGRGEGATGRLARVAADAAAAVGLGRAPPTGRAARSRRTTAALQLRRRRRAAAARPARHIRPPGARSRGRAPRLRRRCRWRPSAAGSSATGRSAPCAPVRRSRGAPSTSSGSASLPALWRATDSSQP